LRNKVTYPLGDCSESQIAAEIYTQAGCVHNMKKEKCMKVDKDVE
jgi:hypothetical protein